MTGNRIKNRYGNFINGLTTADKRTGRYYVF